MAYENPINKLKFPSGRTVGNLKNDAKKRVKNKNTTHCLVLDELASKHSYNKYETWDQAISGLREDLCSKILKARGNSFTEEDLYAFREQHPKLTQFGIDCIRGDDFVVDPDNPLDDNGWPNYLLDPKKSSEDAFPYLERPFDESLKDENSSLFHPGNMILFDRACLFLDVVLPTFHINKNKSRHSYELKHLAEHYFNKVCNPNGDFYIPNGVLIAAALHRGYLVERCGRSAYFNIDEDSLQELEQQIEKALVISNELLDSMNSDILLPGKPESLVLEDVE